MIPRSRNAPSIWRRYSFIVDLAPLFYLTSLTRGRSTERGQQPTFQAASRRYFRRYPRIVLQTGNRELSRELSPQGRSSSSSPTVIPRPDIPPSPRSPRLSSTSALTSNGLRSHFIGQP